MTKEKPFSATFKLEKETKNTVRYAEEAEDRRPIVGTVYLNFACRLRKSSVRISLPPPVTQWTPASRSRAAVSGYESRPRSAGSL